MPAQSKIGQGQLKCTELTCKTVSNYRGPTMVWRQESSLGRQAWVGPMKGCQGLNLLTRSACLALDFEWACITTAEWLFCLFGLILLLGCCLRAVGKEAAVQQVCEATCKLLLHADCGLMQAQMLQDGKVVCGPSAGPKPEAPTESSGAADSKVAALHGMFDLDTLTIAQQP